jgi:hypothetical protein
MLMHPSLSHSFRLGLYVFRDVFTYKRASIHLRVVSTSIMTSCSYCCGTEARNMGYDVYEAAMLNLR